LDFDNQSSGGYLKYGNLTANDRIKDTTSGYEPFRQGFFYKFIEPQSANASDLSDINFFETVRNLDMLRLRRFSFSAGSTFLWDDRSFELGILYDINKHEYDGANESHREANIAIIAKLIPHLKKMLLAGCLGTNGRYKKILIAGHTDTFNDETSNQILSENRAQDIHNAIILALQNDSDLSNQNINILNHVLTPVGHGELQLKIDTPVDTYEERNRRVEIFFKK